MIYCINRFAIYALYPDINISMHIIPGKKDVNTVFAVGKSVINRSSKLDVGSLMLKYGGGGHKAVGTCQIDHAGKADAVKEELIQQIVKAGLLMTYVVTDVCVSNARIHRLCRGMPR